MRTLAPPKQTRAWRGEIIYRAGEPVTHLFRVRSGAVILYVILEDGRRQIIDLAGPGDFLHFETSGELDHFAESLAPTELELFDFDSSMKCPDFVEDYLEQTRRRLAVERRHITMLGRKSAQERLADFLEYVSECLGCPPYVIELPMTRQQVADYLGLTLETVSRIFARWGRLGLLEQTGPGRYVVSGCAAGDDTAQPSLSGVLAAA